MKNDILIIHPQDSTTDFLQGITNFLFDKYGEQRFVFHRPGIGEIEAQSCRSLIEQMPLSSFILFIGHGSSSSLMGARTHRITENILIHRDHLSLFERKNVMFLSCRSSDFLKNRGISGIGFGDIITDMSEVISRREHETNAYRYPKGDITEEDIRKSNELLVDIVKRSLNDYLIEELSLFNLHFRLKLRFNKAIFNLIGENKPSHTRWVANLLLETKTEMKLFLK